LGQRPGPGPETGVRTSVAHKLAACQGRAQLYLRALLRRMRAHPACDGYLRTPSEYWPSRNMAGACRQTLNKTGVWFPHPDAGTHWEMASQRPAASSCPPASAAFHASRLFLIVAVAHPTLLLCPPGPTGVVPFSCILANGNGAAGNACSGTTRHVSTTRKKKNAMPALNAYQTLDSHPPTISCGEAPILNHLRPEGVLDFLVARG